MRISCIFANLTISTENNENIPTRSWSWLPNNASQHRMTEHDRLIVKLCGRIHKHFNCSSSSDMYTLPKKWAVLPFAFILAFALSNNLYIVPQLVISKICLTTFNKPVCDQLGQSKFKTQENDVFEKAAAWNGLINFSGFFPALIITLPLGAMTDLVSKHKMLMLPAIATLISSLIILCSSVFIKLHVAVLILSSFVTCIFGEIPGYFTLACTYAANSCSDDRTLVICLVTASAQIGFAIGGLTANYLKHFFGFSTAFLFTSIVLIVNLLYTVVLIPPVDDTVDEKLSKGEQYDIWDGFKTHTKDAWQHLMSFTRKYLRHSTDNTLIFLLMVAFLSLTAYGGERALIALFLKHSPLNFSADQIGIYITLFQGCRGFGLLFLSLVVDRHCPASDYSLMFLGTVSMIIHYTVLSFSRTMLMVYLSTIFAIPSTFMVSAVRSKVTKLVSSNEHGVSLSLLGLLDVLCELIMSVAANGLFIATAQIYSGFSILLMSVANVISFVILCYIVCRNVHDEANADDYHNLPTEEDKNSNE